MMVGYRNVGLVQTWLTVTYALAYCAILAAKKVVSAAGGDIFWSPSKTEVEIQFFDAQDGILITDHHSSCQTEAKAIKRPSAVTNKEGL
jgi:hypothetical protein